MFAGALVLLSGAGLLLLPGTSEAQRRGWGWGSGGYDPWGYHSGGGSGTSATAVQGSTIPASRQFYPSENLTNPNAAGFQVRLPDAKAEVWFENQLTKQQGDLRQYVSGKLDPNYTYTFHVRARWMENGQPVEQSRTIDARAGQQLNVDFTAPANDKAPANTQRN